MNKKYKEMQRNNINKIKELVKSNKVYIDFADFLLESDLNECMCEEKFKLDPKLCSDLFGIDIGTLQSILKSSSYEQLMDYLIYAIDNDCIMSACNSFYDEEIMYIVPRVVKEDNTFGIYVKLRRL